MSGFGIPCGGEDVHHPFGCHRAGGDLPDDRVVEFFLGSRVTGRALSEYGLHGLDEGHVVPDA